MKTLEVRYKLYINILSFSFDSLSYVTDIVIVFLCVFSHNGAKLQLLVKGEIKKKS